MWIVYLESDENTRLMVLADTVIENVQSELEEKKQT